jgi:hypothetical protein
MAIAAAPYLHAKMSAVEPKLEKPGSAEEHGILVRFVRLSARLSNKLRQLRDIHRNPPRVIAGD